MEPVDIREIDEESMLWTLNDSMDYEDQTNEKDNGILTKQKKREQKAKVSIFARTLDEKNAFISEKYNQNGQE